MHRLNQEHRIPVTEEAIALANGFGVGGEHEFAAGGVAGRGEGADEHEQGGAGQVEIGEERVHNLKSAGRINKNAGAAAAGKHAPVILRGDRFQNAHGGGADGNDAATGGFGFVDEPRRFRADFVTLFVHRVAGERFGFDGRERAEADMQGDETNLDAARANFGKKRFGEMQAGSGRGDGTRRRGINGLITDFVGGEIGGFFSFDVRGEGNFAESVERIQNIRHAGEFEASMAFVVDGDNFCVNVGGVAGGIVKNNFRADARAFAGAQHHPPIVDAIFFEQKNFKLAAGAGVDAAQAGGDDAGVVEHKHIAGEKVFEKLGKTAMGNFLRVPLQDQEAGLIADRRGCLGDQFRRQKEIEIGGLHLRER